MPLPPASPSPLQRLVLPELEALGLRLWVKRDDLLHPHVSGNKWRKLLLNLAEAERQGCTRLITFGGAYSNHLAATAAAGRECGMSTLGIIRGEPAAEMNPTLRFATECGMILQHVSREDYRQPQRVLATLDTSAAYVLPEGGANCLALRGCREIVTETVTQLGHAPAWFICASGTGTTLAGAASALTGQSRALGVAVLKGGFLASAVTTLLEECSTPAGPWQIVEGHLGGYAKWSAELVQFMAEFHQRTGLLLDPIYTGKAMLKLLQLAQEGFFARDQDLIFIHTGGLQGTAGYFERYGKEFSQDHLTSRLTRPRGLEGT